jgi:hypothetical protein
MVLRVYCTAMETLLRHMAMKINQLEKKVDAAG